MQIRHLFLGAALSFAFLATASAQTTVRFTGSTAYRANTHAAIRAQFDLNTLSEAYVGTLSGSRYAVFSGTLLSGGTAVIKTSWSGSEAGIKAVAGPAASNLIAFLPDSVLPTSGAFPRTNSAATNAQATESANADVAMADTFQSTSAYFGRFSGANYVTLIEADIDPTAGVNRSAVGIVPFKFLANAGSPAGLNNLTGQLARALFANGSLPLNVFTGNPADAAANVFAIGRDPDSGTRLTAFAESGVGALATVVQYEPRAFSAAGNAVVRITSTTTGSTTPAGGVLDASTFTTVWPAGVVNGNNVGLGNGGYASGGDLSRALTFTSPSANYLVSYAGVGDADTVIANNGVRELAYNGVTLGRPVSPATYNDVTALTNGLYTFWGYEHMYYRSTLNVNAQGLADRVAQNLYTTNAQVFVSSMQVSRSTDGGIVAP
ncbi:MAG: hypothetical protein JSR82_14050 [Verrucomicrobia bacterium]|nr:hypothetical protein [Verrucomicrobiota bacterium]